jgi:hypothetical protein
MQFTTPARRAGKCLLFDVRRSAFAGRVRRSACEPKERAHTEDTEETEGTDFLGTEAESSVAAYRRSKNHRFDQAMPAAQVLPMS